MPTIKAIYENGALRPFTPSELREGHEYMLVDQGPATEGTAVDIPVPASDDGALQAKIAEFKRLYPGTIGVIDRETADELWSVIERDCRQVEPDGWE
jgi:predicted DNA-binding antitoxin AbrB/MazE fold protein